MLDEVVDSGDEVFYAAEAASANCLLRNESEPTLDLIEPGRVGGSVVNVKAWFLGQPDSYLGVFVGGIVVEQNRVIQLPEIDRVPTTILLSVVPGPQKSDAAGLTSIALGDRQQARERFQSCNRIDGAQLTIFCRLLPQSPRLSFTAD